ncbi:MAG TPA: type II toxin-antitoxin system PemK/MazF family toxin [Planctomycetota bacterium]|nr:type II toxin-antitoxin system PemK/MazF family toxin [Planctomycetota bacterium]
MRRGEVWWAALRAPRGSEPGYNRPVVIVQSDLFNRSDISTVIAAVVTSNLALAAAPGNVSLTKTESGLPKKSVVNVSQLMTLDRAILKERIATLSRESLARVDEGLRVALSL